MSQGFKQENFDPTSIVYSSLGNRFKVGDWHHWKEPIVKLLSWVETSRGSWDVKYYLEIAASSSVEITPIPPFAGTYRLRAENLTYVLEQ